MANPSHPQNSAEKNAQKYFRKAEQSDTLAKDARKKEKATTAAKTAKLRGLRLAKESADKEEADRAAAAKAEGKPGTQPQSKRKRAAPKPAPMVRMTY
jgi:hypothetical protein